MQEDTPARAPLLGRILSPVERLMRGAAAGGVVLIVATAIALLAATRFGDEMLRLAWDQRLAVFLAGRFNLDLTLHHWVNDGAMALFFLLAGLELKREVLVGELASWREAALPLFAAAGGVVLPALIYTAFNHGGPGAAGWAMPAATDIAFAIGILALLSARVPRTLVIFLTALAIADDLAAVVLIAVFYGTQIDARWLHAGAALFVLLLVFNRAGVRATLPYLAVGAILWYALLRSGIHATLAGVLVAVAMPARASCTPEVFERCLAELHGKLHADRGDAATPDDPLRNPRMAEIAAAVALAGSQVQSPLQRLEHALSPWVAFGVVPIFALANAGIDLRAVQWSAAGTSMITVGTGVALVAGKFLGVGASSWAAVRFGVARLPAGVTWMQLLGAAWLSGIGFTMSLFIAQLAFAEQAMVDEAKLGILAGSTVAALAGIAWLLAFCPAKQGNPRPV